MQIAQTRMHKDPITYKVVGQNLSASMMDDKFVVMPVVLPHSQKAKNQ